MTTCASMGCTGQSCNNFQVATHQFYVLWLVTLLLAALLTKFHPAFSIC